MIRVKNLSKYYDNEKNPVLNQLDLDVNEGCFFGLLGPNGCGKTTLISIMTGLIKASSGEVFINNMSIRTNFDRLKPTFALVPQHIALYDNLTLFENLQFFGHLYGLKSDHLHQRIKACVDMAQLEKFQHVIIKKYSGGMQRRANLVLGLLHEPNLLFLDEPTVHVDPQSRYTIFSLLTQLNKQGVTIFYTTHYLEEAEALCNEVAIMDNAGIIAQDSPQRLIAKNPGANNLGDVFLELTGRYLRD